VVIPEAESFTIRGNEHSTKFQIRGEISMPFASIPFFIELLQDISRRSIEPELPCELIHLSDVYPDDAERNTAEQQALPSDH
jgi:hypothetical protein